MQAAIGNKESKLSLRQFLTVAGLPGYLFLFNNILTLIVSRRRDLDNYASIDTSAALQIVFILIVFGLAFHFFLLKHAKIFLNSPLSFLFVFILFCFVSMLWAPNISITGYRAFESLVYYILIVWLIYKLSLKLTPQQLVEWTAYWFIWNIFLDYATILKITSLRGIPLFFQSARTVFPMGVFLILLLSERKIFKILIILFTVFSFSNKVYLGLALGLLGFLWGDSKFKVYSVIGAMVLLISLVFVDFEYLLQNTVFYGRRSIDLSDSSGRNIIWQIALEGILESPLFGHGFVSGENQVLYRVFTSAINVHNSFLSSMLGVGLLGTIPLFIYFIAVGRIALSRWFPKARWRTAIISTFIMSVTISMAAPGIGSRVYGSWIAVVFVFTLIIFLKHKFKMNYFICE